jgi:hypothetical protein
VPLEKLAVAYDQVLRRSGHLTEEMKSEVDPSEVETALVREADELINKASKASTHLTMSVGFIVDKVTEARRRRLPSYEASSPSPCPCI